MASAVWFCVPTAVVNELQANALMSHDWLSRFRSKSLPYAYTHFCTVPGQALQWEKHVIYICQGCFVVVVFVVALVVSHKIRDDVCPGIDSNSHRQYSLFVCLFVCLFVHRLPTQQLHNLCLF